MNNKEPYHHDDARQQDAADDLMQELHELWDRRDAQLRSTLNEGPRLRPTPLSPRKWRYVAAACVVAVAVTAVLWLRPKQPEPATPLLAMNQHESSVVMVPQTTTSPEPTAPTKAADKMEAFEDAMIGMPTDETFVAATIEGSSQQTYVRCNNLCDAREILNQTKDCL